MRKVFKGLMVAGAAAALVIGACAVYVNNYYRADTKAIEAYMPVEEVSMELLEDGIMVYGDGNAENGFIFYPGGKVEYTAYEPLMEACAAEGMLCVLVEMPFNLAVLDINAAEGIPEQYPEVQNWYIGGHSLGGSMAAAHLADNTEVYEGLILLGSYATADISEADMAVLSVFGSEDQVLNREKYEENRSNLPDDFMEIILEGGCHAFFGMYGAQKGDGAPTMTNEEQIELTAEAIGELILDRDDKNGGSENGN